MPTDIERQLARFAEALDREAPTISFDEMVGRGTVAVDVDLLEREVSDRASRVDGVPWIDTTPSHDEIGERDVLIELAPAVAARRPAWRRVALKVALGVAAVAALVVTLAAIERGDDEHDPADVPSSTVPTPLPKSFTSPDGQVTVSPPSTWYVRWPYPGVADDEPDVWFGVLWRGPGPLDPREYIGFVDPVAYDAWCAFHLDELSPDERVQAGSPLLSAPADAAAIAQELIADPDYETTAPVAARVGGVEAVSVDVALAPGGRACGIQMISISRWIHDLAPGLRLRLYLIDLPESMSVQTLAITVVAPEERFDEFIEETAPIIESIKFQSA
jgi:hypothetical protein